MCNIFRMLRSKYQDWPHSPRIILAILLGFALVVRECIQYCLYSSVIDSIPQIVEGSVLLGSTHNQFTFTLLGLMLLLSDAPFVRESTPYELLRVNNKTWIISNYVYVFISSILYYTVIYIFSSLILVLFSPSVSITNTWSAGIEHLARYTPQFAIEEYGLLFPFDTYLSRFSPYSACALTIISNSIYGGMLGLGLLAFNMRGYGFIGWLTVISIHIGSYIMMMNNYTVFMRPLSLLVLAMPGYSSLGDPYVSPVVSIGLLCIISLVIMYYGLKSRFELHQRSGL